MKKLSRFLSLIVSFSLLFVICLSSTASAKQVEPDYTVETPYEYPITASSPEWLKMPSHFERVEACQIPDDILKSMTTPALVETVSNYPLLVDLLLFDEADYAFEVVSTGFNGITELISRPDAYEEIITYVERHREVKDDFIRSAAFGVLALSLNSVSSGSSGIMSSQISAEPASNSIFCDACAVYPRLGIVRQAPQSAGINAQSSNLPRTPSGNSLTVNCYFNRTPELSQEKKNAIEEQVLAVYGLYPSGDATVKYNCHSYAWHQQSTSNLWWIDFPDDYLNDPLVTRAYSPRVGDRIVYQLSSSGRYLHSGVIDMVQNGIVFVKSKWGSWGLYIHTIGNCPSDYGRYTTYWHIN